jgi:hypothetical protein
MVWLRQEIVEGSVLPINKIFAIENDKLHSTFLYVAFRSQNLLKPINDQTSSDTNKNIFTSCERGPQDILRSHSLGVRSNPSRKVKGWRRRPEGVSGSQSKFLTGT